MKVSIQVRKAKYLKPGLILCVISLLLFCPAISHADSTATYYLSVPNSDLSSFTGPYVEVTVDLTSATTAVITATSLTNGGYTYLMAMEEHWA